MLLAAGLRDPSILAAFTVLLLVILSALLAPILPLPKYDIIALDDRLRPMGTPGHILGTDPLGRDLVARLVWGARTTLRIAATVVTVSALVGGTLGFVAGYAGRWADQVIMRLVDIMFTLPGTLIALLLVMVRGAGESTLTLALVISGWMMHARMTRGMMLKARDQPYTEAARALGVRPIRLVLVHILPNLVSTLVCLYVLDVARVIVAESVLSFLGYGVQPPQSSWGLMIADGRSYLPSHPFLATIPGLVIVITLLSINLLVNWLRLVTDPLQRLPTAE